MTSSEDRTAQTRQHELKCWPEFFEEVISGRKLFEIRLNDRNYQVGDVLWQREWFFDTGYTGREVRHRIGYITDWKQDDGYVVMSLAALTSASAAKDWQPIATAPKDGTRVLVHIGSRFGLLIARWDSTAEAWMDDEPFAPDPQPTHWQPLPDPPSESR